MSNEKYLTLRQTEADLDFLVETASPEVRDKERLKQILRHDEDFRSTYVADDKVFGRLMDDDEIFLKISPTLFFEILLRRAAADLEGVGYTFEKSSSMKVPVFLKAGPTPRLTGSGRRSLRKRRSRAVLRQSAPETEVKAKRN